MDFLSSQDGMIGGPGIVVEIDESLFYKRKNNVGRMLGSGWIFGGVERDDHSKCFMVLVPDRKAETLVPIIQQYIRPGSIIISDMWPSYNSLSDCGYIHRQVNHSENFVSPVDPLIHTQNIENFWRWAKRRFLSTTKNPTKRISRLGEHIFRKKFPENAFQKIIEEIKLSYPIL